MKPIDYHIWWADHKLERGPVPAAEAANILVHWLREFPDEPVWLMPTGLDPRSVLEATLISSIGRLRKHIEEMEEPTNESSRLQQRIFRALLRTAIEITVEADEQKMVKIMKLIDNTIPPGKPQEGGTKCLSEYKSPSSILIPPTNQYPTENHE